MNISSKAAKISAHFELPLDTELELGSDCLVALEGVIASRSDSPEEDGTMCQSWRIRAIKGNIVPKKGVSVPMVDKTRKSVKLRSLITHIWGEDYDKVMNVLLANGDELKSFYEKHSP